MVVCTRSSAAARRAEAINDMVHEIRRREQRFRAICRQLVLLNNELRGLKLRYQRAQTAGQRSFIYHYRLQIMTMGGVTRMMTKVAHRMADELDDLDLLLQRKFGVHWETYGDE